MTILSTQLNPRRAVAWRPCSFMEFLRRSRSNPIVPMFPDPVSVELLASGTLHWSSVHAVIARLPCPSQPQPRYNHNATLFTARSCAAHNRGSIAAHRRNSREACLIHRVRGVPEHGADRVEAPSKPPPVLPFWHPLKIIPVLQAHSGPPNSLLCKMLVRR
jgi:hypothetical protein